MSRAQRAGTMPSGAPTASRLPARAGQQRRDFSLLPSPPMSPRRSRRKVIDVNQPGPFLGIQRVVRRCGGCGRRVDLLKSISVAGNPGDGDCCRLYRRASYGLPMLTRAAAIALAPEICVNSITPGIIDTDMMRMFLDRTASRRAWPPIRWAGRAGRGGLRAVLFLASDEFLLYHGGRSPGRRRRPRRHQAEPVRRRHAPRKTSSVRTRMPA